MLGVIEHSGYIEHRDSKNTSLPDQCNRPLLRYFSV